MATTVCNRLENMSQAVRDAVGALREVAHCWKTEGLQGETDCHCGGKRPVRDPTSAALQGFSLRMVSYGFFI